MEDFGSTVEGYDRLTRHERENFTDDGFVLYRAESPESLVGDIYTDVCTFPEGHIYDNEIEFHPNEFRDKVGDIINFEEGEIKLSDNHRDHWQPTSYGVNPDEIRGFAESAVEKSMVETTENPTPIMVEMFVPYSEVEFDLPKDCSDESSEAINRFYVDREKEYRSHYKTPVEWIKPVTIMDMDSGKDPEDWGLEGDSELCNIAHNNRLTQVHYEPITWELNSGSLEDYPTDVRKRVDKDNLRR